MADSYWLLIEQKLVRLERHAHERIRRLSSDLRADFDYIFNISNALHDTADYPRLYNLVRSVFRNNRQGQRYAPGTVGAYFTGCTNQAQLPSGYTSGCSATCAGSMPLPQGHQWCNVNVILAEWIDHQYRFTDLIWFDDGRNTIIHIQGTKFIGFSEEEKRQLKERGVTLVDILGTDYRGERYISLTQGLVSIDRVATRVNIPKDDESSEGGKGILLLIIVIIILFAVLYYTGILSMI